MKKNVLLTISLLICFFSHLFGSAHENPGVLAPWGSLRDIAGCDAGTITGPLDVCSPATGVVYTATGIPEATSYYWIAPPGAVIVSGQGTVTITVDFPLGSVSGTLQVTATCPEGTGSPSSILVAVYAAGINGNSSVCKDEVKNYSTQSGMSNYSWTVPSGGVIIGPSDNDVVSIQWNAGGIRQVHVGYTSPSCALLSASMDVNVNLPVGIPVFASGTASTRCQSASTVTYTATASNSTAITYSLDGVSLAAGNTINSSSGAVTYTAAWYGNSTITATATGCNGPTVSTHAVTTFRKPSVNPVGSYSYCNGATTAPITFSGPLPGTLFSWTNNNTSIGLGPGGTGNIPSFTAANAGTSTLSAMITVTPTSNGCTGNPWTFMITVYPSPNVFASPASQSICSSNYILTINLSSNVSTAIFNWTRDNVATVTGIPASGTGNIFGALNNTTLNPVLVTFTITPVANGCSGIPATATVLVSPKPNAVATPASQAICSSAAISTILLTGNLPGTTFNWVRNNVTTVTGIPASGSGNISGTLTNTTNAPVTVTFTVTPLAGSCSGTSVSATVLVNPTPVANTSPATQVICSAGTITPIISTGNVAGTVYNWTRDNVATVTGIAASGAGTISGILNNTTFLPVTVTFTITPVANGCAGLPVTATVLVNPKPDAIASPSSQAICSAGSISTIALTGSVPGTTFGWTRDNVSTVTGIPASGSGDISGTLTNTILSPVTVTFTITPATSGCTGVPVTSTVLVTPIPIVDPVTDAEYCAGTATTPVVFSGAVPGTIFSWINTNTAIGLGPSGTGDITSFTATNPGLSPISGTITVTPSINGCSGQSISFNITVDPMIFPSITGFTSACAGNDPLIYTTEPGMNNYVWTVSPGNDIVNGQGTYQAGIVWNSAGLQWISVSYSSPGGCATSPQAQLNVFVEPLPGPAGNITGPSEICGGTTGAVYSTDAILYTNNYIWILPPGAVITAGAGTSSITVDFDSLAQPGNILVHGNNICGDGTSSAPFAVNVTPIPAAPFVTVLNDNILHSDALSGNQWYFEDTLIPGATGQEYVAEQSGEYWCTVTMNGCSSDTSNHVRIVIQGLKPMHDGRLINIYPVPNNGRFHVLVTGPSSEVYSIRIFDHLGKLIQENTGVDGRECRDLTIDMNPSSPGIYTLILESVSGRLTRRIVVVP